MAEQDAAKRKSAYRFTALSDVDLLKEVLFVNPHDSPYGHTKARWEEVASNMRSIHGDGLTASGCRKRFDDLIVAFKADNIKSLRASGTEEQHHEREQLIQAISDMLDNVATKKKLIKEESGKTADKQETDGHAIRDAAMYGIKRKAMDGEGCEPERKEQRVAGSMREAANAVASFASVMKATSEVKQQEVQVQKDEAAIALRRLELDEARFALEKAEREERFALERQERQALLQCMQGTLELMRSIVKKE